MMLFVFLFIATIVGYVSVFREKPAPKKKADILPFEKVKKRVNKI